MQAAVTWPALGPQAAGLKRRLCRLHQRGRPLQGQRNLVEARGCMGVCCRQLSAQGNIPQLCADGPHKACNHVTSRIRLPFLEY